MAEMEAKTKVALEEKELREFEEGETREGADEVDNSKGERNCLEMGLMSRCLMKFSEIFGCSKTLKPSKDANWLGWWCIVDERVSFVATF